MQIEKEPDNYQGAFREVVYTIGQVDPNRIVEVEIYDDAGASVIGHKRLRGSSSYELNVANYLQQQFDVRPLAIVQTQITPERSRNVYSKIGVDGVVTQKRIVTAGIKNGAQGVLMTDAPSRRSIAMGEIDELSICCPNRSVRLVVVLRDGANVGHRVEFAAKDSGEDINVVRIGMEWLDGYSKQHFGSPITSFREMEIVVERDELPAIVHRYTIVAFSPEAVRMCWLNPYGAIDYYTFAKEIGRSVDVRKSKIYSDQGYKVVGSESQTLRTLLSEYEPRATMEWLSQMLASPRVWIYENRAHMPVDLTTSAVQTNGVGLLQLKIDIRATLNTNYQRF